MVLIILWKIIVRINLSYHEAGMRETPWIKSPSEEFKFFLQTQSYHKDCLNNNNLFSKIIFLLILFLNIKSIIIT